MGWKQKLADLTVGNLDKLSHGLEKLKAKVKPAPRVDPHVEAPSTTRPSYDNGVDAPELTGGIQHPFDARRQPTAPAGSTVQLDSRGRVTAATGDAAVELAKKANTNTTPATSWGRRLTVAGLWAAGLGAVYAMSDRVQGVVSKIPGTDVIASWGGRLEQTNKAVDAQARVAEGAVALPPVLTASAPVSATPAQIDAMKAQEVVSMRNDLKEIGTGIGLPPDKAQCMADFGAAVHQQALSQHDFITDRNKGAAWSTAFKDATVQLPEQCKIVDPEQKVQVAQAIRVVAQQTIQPR